MLTACNNLSVLPIVMLSLRKSPRHSQALRYLAERSLPMALFDGVDGSELAPQSETFELGGRTIRNNKGLALALHNRPLGAGEIGCALSHLMIYLELLQQGLPAMLIMEDDARFRVHDQEVLRRLSLLPSFDTFDLCLLQWELRERYTASEWVNREYYRCTRPNNGTYGYIITKRFAERIASDFELHSAADGYLRYLTKLEGERVILVSQDPFIMLDATSVESDVKRISEAKRSATPFT